MSGATEQGLGKPRALRLEGFAKRQWNADYKGLVIQMPMEELEAKVNELYWQNPAALQDGYAPFCKHLFVPCFLEGACAEAVPITDDNKQQLLSEVCTCASSKEARERARLASKQARDARVRGHAGERPPRDASQRRTGRC